MKTIPMLMVAMLLGSMAWALGDFHHIDGNAKVRMPCAAGAEKQLEIFNEYKIGENGAKEIMEAIAGGGDGETPLQEHAGTMGTTHGMA